MAKGLKGGYKLKRVVSRGVNRGNAPLIFRVKKTEVVRRCEPDTSLVLVCEHGIYRIGGAGDGVLGFILCGKSKNDVT